MQRIVPHLWFDGAAEAAAALYTGLVPGSSVGRISRYTEAGFALHGQPAGAVMTVEFTLGGFRMAAINGGPFFTLTPAVSYFVTLETEAEVARFWAALADDGEVLMPLDAYPWSPSYGWLNDRNGLSWQVAYGKRSDTGGQAVTPAFLFTGDLCGRAEEAAEFYLSVFPDSGIEGVLRYDGSGADASGTVQHMQFRLFGQTFMAMDSAVAGPFPFTPANSHLILCEDQPEIDRYWAALSAVPEQEQCGWLQDRFGVSWQVAPRRLIDMMTDPDSGRVARVTDAFMSMKKLDLPVLEAAFAD